MTVADQIPKITVALVGGPLDGLTYAVDRPTDRLVFPMMPAGYLWVSARAPVIGGPDQPPRFRESHYHRTGRTDAGGREVYEFRG